MPTYGLLGRHEPPPLGATRWQPAPEYAFSPDRFTGTGYDEAGNLHGYRVEVYREHDGKYLYR